eukprot:1679808-Lingulodinium_polyedra.AAC.1
MGEGSANDEVSNALTFREYPTDCSPEQMRFTNGICTRGHTQPTGMSKQQRDTMTERNLLHTTLTEPEQEPAPHRR